ncbi:hypothetical protein [Aureivirga sp. CE67]|uniref:hypothetical protein n=1 Tax=Aureivirga sp. CE67 TaxID=1788983 RepID=UPI0018CBC757|nr:hypothetical protein [Aureivirga sp. CE67]
MKFLLTMLILLVLNSVYSQNKIEVNDDKYSMFFYESLRMDLANDSIKNIENSTEKIIRIWRGHQMFSFSQKNCIYSRKFINSKNNKIYFYKQSLDITIDTISINLIKSIKPKVYLGCIFTAIEIVENNHYFFKSIGCKNFINSLIFEIYNEKIKSNIENYIQNLPSGVYKKERSSIGLVVNQPIKDVNNQSSFYKRTVKLLSENNIKIDDPLKQPLILINSQQSFFEDVNELNEKDVKSVRVFDKSKDSTYTRVFSGDSGKNGVLIIKTK